MAAFTLIEVMVAITVISIVVAAGIPALTASKKQTYAAALANDLRTFSSAFDTYAHETGAWPAEVAVGILPPEMATRINGSAWRRITPIGGHYNWDYNQLHQGTRYKAVIQISDTPDAPLPQDIELWERIDKLIDDGNLSTGNFRLGADDEPIYIIAP